MLCHALAFNPATEKTVLIGRGHEQIQCVAKKILYDDAESELLLIEMDDVELVVKIAKTKRFKGIISSFEHRNYHLISQIEGIGQFILQLREEYKVQYGFVMEYAENEGLEAWIESCDFETPSDRDLALKPIFLHVFHALRLLHQNQWFHKDIRPGNIVITGNGTAKLIDWATAIRLDGATNEFPVFEQGHGDYFWPENLALASQPAKWDLAALGLVIAFLSVSEQERVVLFHSSRRWPSLANYGEDHPDTMACVGVKMYQICSVIEGEIDYNQVERLLTSFGV
jgi:serine/threonine protein kinase